MANQWQIYKQLTQEADHVTENKKADGDQAGTWT